MLIALLDVADSFDRVFRAVHAKEDQVTPQMKIWLGNFRSVRRLLEKLLTDAGVTPIENVAGRFDPAWHKAAEAIVDTERPEGMIVEELKKGYLWKGQLLRKAEVTVVRHEADEETG